MEQGWNTFRQSGQRSLLWNCDILCLEPKEDTGPMLEQQGESDPGLGNSMYKGPEVGKSLLYSGS